jgi:hypothetical protein
MCNCPHADSKSSSSKPSVQLVILFLDHEELGRGDGLPAQLFSGLSSAEFVPEATDFEGSCNKIEIMIG